MSLVDKILDDLIRREGGFVNNPADKGGPTKYGITQQTLSEWRGRPVTAGEVQQLTEQEAREIYTARYVAPFKRFAASPDLMGLIVDSAVQHGVGRVQGWLREIPSTDPAVNYREVLRRRIRFYGQLITRVLRDADKDGIPDNTEFAEGWMNRVSEFVR